MDPADCRRKGVVFLRWMWRWWFSFIFSIALSSAVAFAGVLLSFLVAGKFSLYSPAYIDSRCKILSSNLDIRFAKVCEYGIFNYRVKGVYSAAERTKLRCRYDYYWASVFEVQYIHYPSGKFFYALAEVPKEALPLDCRPSFGTAWLTKDKFKVNETYDCKYVPGNPKVDIYGDDFFRCQLKEPSLLDLIFAYFPDFLDSIQLWFSLSGMAGDIFLYTNAIVILGVPLITLLVLLLKLFLKQILSKNQHADIAYFSISKNRLRRTFLILACISSMGWLSVQYSKSFGLLRTNLSLNDGEMWKS